jgi:hypothetical protein
MRLCVPAARAAQASWLVISLCPYFPPLDPFPPISSPRHFPIVVISLFLRLKRMTMSLSTKYNPSEVEDKWYDHWLKSGYFHSEPNADKEPFCVVMPPPNVTGVLHMGHMLNNTIQDVLIRRARMQGK